MKEEYLDIEAEPPERRAGTGRPPHPVYQRVAQGLLDGVYEDGKWHLVMVSPQRRHGPLRRRLKAVAPNVSYELRTAKVSTVDELKGKNYAGDHFAYYIRVPVYGANDSHLAEPTKLIDMEWEMTEIPLDKKATNDQFAFADEPIEGDGPEPQQQPIPKGIWDR